LRIRRVAILPSLFTLGNALCGFAAITFTTRAVVSPDELHAVGTGAVMWAGYFVVLAMVFDAVDGRVARFARVTTDFGGQLDSVADAVSFGLAPAFLMNRVVVECLREPMQTAGLGGFLRLGWVCAAVYMGCALIRLARFNVENVHDEEAHMTFRGLPSPAAAGALVSMLIVLAAFWHHGKPGQALVCRSLLWALPAAAVVLGLLMVSNLRYIHLLNYCIRGRRPISHLVLIVLGIAMVALLREKILLVGFGAYAASGLLDRVVRKRKGRAPGEVSPPPLGDASTPEPGSADGAAS